MCLQHLVLTLLASFAINATAGEVLRDPTQPPVALMPAPAAEGETEAGPTLQSVILRKGRKPLAIIDGQRVELGGKYGDSTLVRVSESSVTLDGPGGRNTLRLTPAVEKRPTLSRAQKQKSGSDQ